MDTLVTIEQLAERLPFEMDADDTREAEGALSDLSNDARTYGLQSWATEENTPYFVKNLIIRAAARHMKNYEGYTFSRAGDETVQWTDRGEKAGTAYFTSEEKDMLRSLTGQRTFGTLGTYAWGTKAAPEIVGRVPHADGRKVIPHFATEEPW